MVYKINGRLLTYDQIEVVALSSYEEKEEQFREQVIFCWSKPYKNFTSNTA